MIWLILSLAWLSGAGIFYGVMDHLCTKEVSKWKPVRGPGGRFIKI